MRNFLLADELFLIGHDEYTGKSVVNATLLDTGLAGAVVGELILAGRATIADGRVTVQDSRPSGEPVSDAALAEMIKRPTPHVVRAWVEYLRDEVREIVGRRLIAAGVVRREQSRGLTLRPVVRFPAVTPIEAAGPQVRLRYIVSRREEVDAQTALLAALVLSTSLEPVLALDTTMQSARDQLMSVVELLPAPLAALAKGVDTAVAAIALTVRR